MMAFPGMLAAAATKAGMKVPEDCEDFNANDFPHFAVFCGAQLNRPMRDLSEHWDNAKIIVAISDEDIRKVTMEDLIAKGLSYSQ